MNEIVEYLKTKIGTVVTDSPSAAGRWLAGKLLEVEAGKLKVEYTVRPEMTNPIMLLHGGMTALMIDDIIGATVFTLNSNIMYITVNLNIDYLSSAKEGDKVIAESGIVRKGRSVINAEAVLKSENGTIIARATSNLVARMNQKMEVY